MRWPWSSKTSGNLFYLNCEMSPEIFVLSAWSPAGATISVGSGNFENQGIISETGHCEHIQSWEIVTLINSLTLWGSDAQSAVI